MTDDTAGDPDSPDTSPDGATGDRPDGQPTVPEDRFEAWSGFSTTRYGETNRWPWLYRTPDASGSDERSLQDRWYWDADARKAYYPCHVDEETVHFVTVWHRDEVAGALADGGLCPIADLGPDRTENQFVDGPLDSFRLLDDAAIAAYRGAVDHEEQGDGSGEATGATAQPEEGDPT